MNVQIISVKEESKLRGDVDNYVKSLLDGLNGVAYDDDKQVVNLHAYKR
jgi:Holliday junction resolvase RusA-like endonuclease